MTKESRKYVLSPSAVDEISSEFSLSLEKMKEKISSASVLLLKIFLFHGLRCSLPLKLNTVQERDSDVLISRFLSKAAK